MSRCPLVMIEWQDSSQPVARWQHVESIELPRPINCVSVGWLLRDGETKVLAPNFGAVDQPENLQAAGVITIPAACVVKITKLREPTFSFPVLSSRPD